MPAQPAFVARTVICCLLLAFSEAELQAASTIWAATRAGVYKSIDDGTTWQQVPVTTSNTLLQGSNPPTPDAFAIALDPQQPSTVYFVGSMQGSSGIGFYRSTDNGKSWTSTVLVGMPLGHPVSFLTTWLLIDPLYTNVIYLGFGGGVAKSMDYGASWTRLTLPLLPNSGGNRAVPDGLSVDPNLPGVLYLSSLAQVFRSADFGETWSPSSLVATGSGIRLGDVRADPRNPGVLYVGTSGGGSPFCTPPGQACGLFRSSDNGKSWKNVAPVGEYFEVVFDPVNNDLYNSGGVVGVGSSVVKSNDGGTTWTPVSNKLAPHLLAEPSRSGILYGYQWGNNAWFRSSDSGVSFTTGFIATTGNDRGINMLAVPRRLGNVSAASFQSGPLAPESIVSALGFSLATVSLPNSSQPPGTSLGGTTVTVTDAAGVSRPAPLFYVSPGQVNYQIPAGTAPGVATVVVKSGDGAISSATLAIAAVSPAIFTLNSTGLAAAYALRVSGGAQTYENVYQVDSSNAVTARPIDLGPASDLVYLLLYGTGLRGSGAVSVRIAGETVPVLFAGPQGEFAGEDQVNIGPLPRSLSGRGSVSVVLAASGQTANAVTVTIR